MQNFELEQKLKEKSIDEVKRVNPAVKKFIVTIINKTGKLFFLFKKNKLPGKTKKILFISLYFNGDVLFQSPLFELIKNLYPDAEAHIWIKSRTKALMDGYPYFEKVFIYNDIRTRRYDENINGSVRSKLQFFKKLKEEHYDLVFDLTGLFWTAAAIFKAKPKYSSGFNFHGFGFLYNFESNAITTGHLVDKNLDIVLKNPEFQILVNKLNKVNKDPSYFISEKSKHHIDSIFLEKGIQDNSKKIILHTTAGWKAKSWDVLDFLALTNEIDSNYDIFLVGGREDIENAKIIIEKTTKRVFDFTGVLSINESAEIIRRADYFIGADSGPLYIAEAVGTRTISLFGPTNPLFSAPRDEKHRYIYYELFCSADKKEQNCKLMAGLNCRTHDCMKEIKVRDVIDKINSLSAN